MGLWSKADVGESLWVGCDGPDRPATAQIPDDYGLGVDLSYLEGAV